MKGANNGVPNINGQMYGWADVKVNIGSTLLTGITAVSYSESQTIDKVYGAGRYPIGYGKGRIEPSASLTLYQEELIALQKAAPNGRLQDLAPFDIVVSYLPEDGVIVTDVIKGCKFNENKREVAEGDTSVKVECELTCMQIKFNQ